MALGTSVLVLAGLDERDQATLAATEWLCRGREITSAAVAYLKPKTEFPPYWPPAFVVPEPTPPTNVAGPLAELSAKLQAGLKSNIQVESIVLEEATAADVIRLISARSADLVCLGRTLTGKEDELSSLTAAIVRKAPCTVFVVPETFRAPTGCILVPVDFSETSHEALTAALQLSRSSGGVPVVAQHSFAPSLGYYRAGSTYEEFEKALEAAAREHALQWSQSLDVSGVPLTWRFDLSEVPDLTICQTADQLDAQLIVLGGHGRTLPSGILLGHTADRVATHARRPVLCIKQKGKVVHFLQALAELFEVN